MPRIQPSKVDKSAFDLLVACTDWPASAERDHAIAAAHHRLGGDWEAFVALAERHHVAILAAHSLSQAGIEAPAGLRAMAGRQKRRALSLAGEALRLVSALDAAGVDAAWLKGPLLSAQLYGDIAMRQSVDLDLLVEWDDFRAAVGLLESEGYRLLGHTPPWDDWRIGLWRELAKDITFAGPDRRTCLELHHRLKSPAALLPGLGLSQANDSVTVGGRKMRAYSRSDLFVYLCVHASTSLWDRLKWLADIRALLADLDASEIAALQAHSHTLGTERCTALGLLLCHRLWGQAIPREVEEWPATAPWLADLERASLERLMGPERAYTSFANSFDRRRLRELRGDPAYRRAQLTELIHDRELLETVRLPRWLRALYFPLRLWLFIRRKLGFAPDPRFATPR